VSSDAIIVAVLAVLVGLRALAAAAEVAIGTGLGGGTRRRISDATLAGTARATAHVTTATIVGLAAGLAWERGGWIAVVPAVAVVVAGLLLVADLVPRGLASELSATTRRRLRGLLAAVAVVASPLVAVGRLAAAGLLGRTAPRASLAALRRLGGWTATRPVRGPLDVSEAGLVARIVRFASKTARDALVPLVDVCAVPDTASVGDALALVRERGFSRLPVFHERVFNVLGLVSSLDLLGVPDPRRPVRDVMREALFVPESKPLPELLTTLQAEGRNLAVVVDEYGGAVGLVTVEDLVEEIVGEIEDEYDVPRDLYRRIAPGVYLLSARAPVTEVNERFGWNLPQGEYETIGGLVLERLGRVPKPGDGLPVGRVRIEVARASARAVLEVRVEEMAGLAERARRWT
jgi:putative hemolysin